MSYRSSKADRFRAALLEFDEYKQYLLRRLAAEEITKDEYEELLSEKADELDI